VAGKQGRGDPRRGIQQIVVIEGAMRIDDCSAPAMPLSLSNEWKTAAAADHTQTLRCLRCIVHLSKFNLRIGFLVGATCNIPDMKLIRFGEPGQEKPGVLLDDQTRLDASGCVPDYDEKFFADGGLARLASWLEHNSGKAPRVEPTTRLGPPIARPSKIVCVGLNFRDHAEESKMEIPKEPVLFFKATSSLAGPNDEVVMPRGGEKLDWEVELAIIIGKRASYVPTARAYEFVAGYALHNDYSERSFQLERGGQWVKGKSADSFAPLGPFLATSDEMADPGRLAMWLKVNGQYRQRGTTANMIFDVPFLVSYISNFMTLLPGDVISTGTPAGVALGMKPPQYLKPGDMVELGIEGLGSACQKVAASS
jgi:2,4-diketo-3-deoxy-L-fuconate hydrolase